LGLLPALPITGIFAALGRYLVEEPDEYVRLATVRQSLIEARHHAPSLPLAFPIAELFDLLIESIISQSPWRRSTVDQS